MNTHIDINGRPLGNRSLLWNTYYTASESVHSLPAFIAMLQEVNAESPLEKEITFEATDTEIVSIGVHTITPFTELEQAIHAADKACEAAYNVHYEARRVVWALEAKVAHKALRSELTDEDISIFRAHVAAETEASAVYEAAVDARSAAQKAYCDSVASGGGQTITQLGYYVTDRKSDKDVVEILSQAPTPVEPAPVEPAPIAPDAVVIGGQQYDRDSLLPADGTVSHKAVLAWSEAMNTVAKMWVNGNPIGDAAKAVATLQHLIATLGKTSIK